MVQPSLCMREAQGSMSTSPNLIVLFLSFFIKNVLVGFQENPKAAQEHMINKIQKLVSAGIFLFW